MPQIRRPAPRCSSQSGRRTTRTRAARLPASDRAHSVVFGVVRQLDQAEGFHERWHVATEATAQALLDAVPAAARVRGGAPPPLDRAGLRLFPLVSAAQIHPVAV